MYKEAFYHKVKDTFCEEILTCMAWYTPMEHSLILHEHQQWSVIMDFSYISDGYEIGWLGHRTCGTQCNSFTSKSGIPTYDAQYRFTHRYLYKNNIYRAVCMCMCVCVHAHVYLNISTKFKYLLFIGIPFAKTHDTKFCSLIMEWCTLYLPLLLKTD